MKKVFALLLALCIIFTAFPLCVWAESSDLTITTNIERDMYYTEDTFTVTLDLNNCADGFSSLRGRLNYDSENITFNSFKFETKRCLNGAFFIFPNKNPTTLSPSLATIL